MARLNEPQILVFVLIQCGAGFRLGPDPDLVGLDRNFLSIDVTGELWINPLPEKLFVKTLLDLESSQCSLREAVHG